LEPFELFDEIHGKGRRGFNLHRRERTLFSDEQIDLVAVGGAEEIDLRSDPTVYGCFRLYSFPAITIFGLASPCQGIFRHTL
jgi:hypothetical protein